MQVKRVPVLLAAIVILNLALVGLVILMMVVSEGL